MKFAWAIVAGSLLAACGAAEPIEINVSSTPALPISNMLPDADFGKDAAAWRGNSKDGAGLSMETAPNGKSSFRVSIGKSESGKTRTMHCQSERFKRPLIPGQTYIAGIWMNAGGDLDNSGGIHHGAGVIFSVYDKSWKRKAQCQALSNGSGERVHLVSKPLTIPDWGAVIQFHAGVFYAFGTATFDSPTLTEAYVKLDFQVKSRDLLQVIVEDEAGRIVFDSGELTPGTSRFAKSIDVLSPYRYSVRAINRNGRVALKNYPADETR